MIVKDALIHRIHRGYKVFAADDWKLQHVLLPVQQARQVAQLKQTIFSELLASIDWGRWLMNFDILLKHV